MCGISGIVSLNNEPLNYDQLIKMTSELKHRGPDAGGYLVTNNSEFPGRFEKDKGPQQVKNLEHPQHIGLGHRRLSITDLSVNASQPMNDETQRYWIVFNGQIYNHAELRDRLVKKGYVFKTSHSDTEVLLNAYRCWGVNCVAEFNGTWSFCLWDSHDNSIFIARDRVGARPFYYTVCQQTLYFASELNAIIANDCIKKELDEFAVYDYLTYTHVPAPSTILKNIKKLPAAHYLFFKPGEPILPQQYWSPITTQPPVTLSEQEIIHQIREKFGEAVRTRMQADVNIGMLLSGGLDSSANLAYMSKFSSQPVKTYTAGFENSPNYKNEFEHAKKVATLFKADHHEVLVTEKDFLDFLPRLAYLQDEPIADPAITPLHFISESAARDQVKVLLGGEGSDELFIGYQHWRLIYEFEKMFLNRPRLASAIAYLHRKSVFKGRRPHYLGWALKLKNQWPTFWSGTELRTEGDKHRILNADFLHKMGSYTSFAPVQPLYDDLIAAKPYKTFDWMSANDLQHRLPDQLLARLDRMMMSASIEGRHPFLDVNLVEFSLRIPQHLKVKQRTEKYLLKKAFEPFLPREIVYRRKDSFSVPMASLFANAERKKHYLEVIANFNKKTGIFRAAYLKELESPAKLREFWNVLNLALWHAAHM